MDNGTQTYFHPSTEIACMVSHIERGRCRAVTTARAPVGVGVGFTGVPIVPPPLRVGLGGLTGGWPAQTGGSGGDYRNNRSLQ